jgi:TPR repeat protein
VRPRSLRYAHANLWVDDPAYRWSWYVWPQCVVALIAGLILFNPANSPTDINSEWATPSTVLDVGTVVEALRDKAYESRAAFERLQKLSSAGGIMSPAYLGTLYDPNIPRRSSVVAADATSAVKWYKLSAKHGAKYYSSMHAVNFAQSNLILLLISVRYGVQDIAGACNWTRKLGNLDELFNASRKIITKLKKIKNFCDERTPNNSPAPAGQTTTAAPITLSQKGWSVVPSIAVGGQYVPNTSELRGWSEQFISALYNVLSTDERDLSKFYADKVLYYGKEISLDQLEVELRAFLQRWPVRRYIPKQGSINTDCDQSTLTCTVTGVVQFDAQSAPRNRRSVGEATFKYRILFSSSVKQMPKILEEGGAVIHRNVQALSSEPDDSNSNFFDRLSPKSGDARQ